MKKQLEEVKEYKFTKKEVAKILGVSEKKVERLEKKEGLESELNKVGYRLYMKKKEGRKVYYLCIDSLDKEHKELYNDFCDSNRVRKKDEFAKYFETRIVNIDNPVSKLVVASVSNISKQTVITWDKKLLELGLLSKEGWFYMAIDYKRINGEIKPYFRLTDEYEYKAHAKIKAQKTALLKKYKTKKVSKLDEDNTCNIDEETFQIAYDSLVKQEEKFNGTFVYRLNRYKVKDIENVGNIMLWIKDTYNLKEEDLIITYDASMLSEEYTNDFLEGNYYKLDKNI